MAAVRDKELFARYARWVLHEHAAGRLQTDKAVVELWTAAVDHPDPEAVASSMRGVLEAVARA